MEFLLTLLYFIVVISILVTVHEWGHFMAARLTGTRAEVFSIGMGNRVVGWNAISGFSFGNLPDDWDGGDHTDYRVSMLPFGGYVKISGMIDESMDTEQMNQPAKPYEFRSKGMFAKLFIMSAGVIMNVILALVIYVGLTATKGKTVAETTTIAYVEKNTLAEKIGFQSGDKILSINGESVTSWSDVIIGLTSKNIGSDRTVVIERTAQKQTLSVSGVLLMDSLTASQGFLRGLTPAGYAVMLTAVETLNPAGRAGLQAGDTILSLNSTRIVTSQQFIEIVQSNKEKQIVIEYKRANSVQQVSLQPNTEGRLGVQISGVYVGPMRTEHYSFGESVIKGTEDAVNSITGYIAGLKMLVSGKVPLKQSVGGPIQIAKMSKQAAETGIEGFLRFLALFSIILAVMNIMPIPAFDGGHIVIVLIEGAIRRELPTKVKIGIQQVGLVLFLVVMVFVFYADLTR
jgi:regulator of sigma E protease